MWVEPALKELGNREVPGTGSNPRILEYLRTVNIDENSDEIPWCSAFVNFIMRNNWICGTNKANARSWIDFGLPSEKQVGAIIVLERGTESWMGHVGFLLDWRDDGSNMILSGNTNNRVEIALFTNKALAIRMPDMSKVYA